MILCLNRTVRAVLSLSCLLPVLSVPAAADELDPVTITASPIGSRDAMATLVGSVDRAALLTRGAASLGDALADVPGVSASGFAPGASQPLVRGFGSNRVRVLENGLGSFDVADVGPDHGTPIDPLSAERIEIVRGAGSLRYGNQAIGGVVNVLNNRVPWRPPSGAISGELSVAGSTSARARELAGGIEGGRGMLAWHADGFRRRTEDYRTPDGRLPGSGFDGEGGAVGASLLGSTSRAGVALVHYGADYGLPNESARISMAQEKWLLRAAHDFDAGILRSLTLDAGGSDYGHRERDAGEVAATFLDRQWEARSEAVFGSVGPFSAAAMGLQAQHRRYSALGEGADYLAPTLTQSQALFGFAELPAGTIATMQVGLRIENADVEGHPGRAAAVSRHFSPLSASVSAAFTPRASLQLGLTLATSERAPAQTELFAQGPHEGSGTFELGNDALGLERSHALEATAHWQGTGLHVEAALWMMRFDNFIHGAMTGRRCDEQGLCAPGDGEALRELVYRQRDARFHGAELSVDLDLGQFAGGALVAGLAGDFVRATFAGGGNVPRIPPWKGAVSLSWERSFVQAGLTLRQAGRQDRPGELDTPTPGWTSVDAQLALRPGGSRALEVSLVGRNLAGGRQRNAAAFNKDEVLAPGRDLRLVLRLRR